jgi:serine phosphatase RsbU (regulator of sigma subunit)
MAAARAFQQGLLPEREAVVQGVGISCRHRPSSEIGGDLYDYACDRSGRTALLVADVAGHGAPAAMLTAVVKSAFRASERDEYDPAAVTDRVRAAVEPFGFERFVTLIAVRISPEEGCLTFVNAGHPPALLWDADGVRDRLEGTGPLLSPALTGARWERATRPMKRGDHLLLYTDGVIDALFRDGDGEGRIRTAVEHHRSGGAGLLDVLLREIERHAGGHPPQDDLTLLTATRLA